MAGYVDEKVAKVTLDNKGFTKNAQDTISALDKLKAAFSKINGGDASKNISKQMDAIPDAISKSTTKSQGLLSRLKNIFSRSTENINMSGAAKSIDQMNTEVADRTSKTSSILSRLKGIFQKADNHQGFKNSIQSIDNLNVKANKVNLNPLTGAFSKASESVKSSLSAMDVAMGIVMGNMMQKAINFGAKFFHGALDGLNEYKEKLGSVQTIMTNTEWEIPDQSQRMQKTSKTLEDLNEYADKTIYSFKDMTKNIGTFTAAGVGLEDSATAIKGISNLAAASGSNTEQASMAMYQLSQALASGKVGLQDWNSVVNAGMGGKLFQDRLTQMAEKMGHARDMTKSFRESLKDGWLTSEVLIATLKDFSVDEQMLKAATQIKSFGQLVDTVQEAIGSGWATTWEYLFGGYEEARNLWTKIGEIINPFFDDAQGKYQDTILGMERSLGNYRNAMLKTWKDLGGQQMFFDTIANGFEFVFKSLTHFRDGFREAIGTYEDSAIRLVNFTRRLHDFSENLKKNAAIQETLIAVGRMFGNVFLTASAVTRRFFQGFSKGLGSLDGVILVFKRAADGISKFMSALRQNNNVMTGIQNIGKIVGNVFGIFGTVFKIAAEIVRQFFSLFNFGSGSGKGFLTFTEVLLKITEGVRSFVESIYDSIKKFGVFKGLFKGLTDGISKFVPALGNGIKSIFAAFPKTFSDNGIFGKIGSVIQKGISTISPHLKTFKDTIGKGLSTVGDDAKAGIAKLKSGFASAFGKIGSGIVNILKGVADGVKNGYNELKSAFKTFDVSSIIKSIIGLLAFDKWLAFKKGGDSIFDKVLNGVKSSLENFIKQGKPMVDQVGGILGEFKGVINQFSKGVKVGLLFVIAGAILMLSFALDKLSKIDIKDLSKAMIAMGATMAGMMKVLSVLGAIDSIPKGSALTLISFAISISILAGALKKLQGMDMDSIVAAAFGIRVLMRGMSVAMNSMSKIDGNVTVGVFKMIAFALAVRILAGAVSKLRDMDIPTLVTALIGVRALMQGLASCMQQLNGTVVGGRTMVSMIAFAISLRILVMSVKAIAKIQPESAVQGILGTVALMKALQYCMKQLSGTVVGGRTMLSMISFAISLRILVMSVKAIAKLQPEAAVQGILGAGAMMGALVFCMKKLDGTVVGGRTMLSMIAFAGALYLLAMSVKKLAKLPIDSMAASVTGVTVLVLAMSKAMKSMGKVEKVDILPMIVFAGSLYILSLSVEKIAKLNWEQMAIGMTGVTSLIAEMLIAMKLASKIKTDNSSVLSLISFAGTMYLLAKTVETLSKINLDDSIKALGTMAALMGELLVVSIGLKKIKIDMSSMGSLIIFAGTIYLLGKSIEKLSKIPWGQQLASMGSISGVILALSYSAKMMGNVGGSIQQTIQTGILFEQFARLIGEIGDSLKKTSEIPWQNLLVATGAISGVILGLIGVVKIMSKMDGNANNVGEIVALAGAMWSIGNALSSVAKHDWKNILAATVSIAAVMLIMAQMMKVLEGASFGSAGKLILLAVGLTALAVPIALLSSLNLVAVGISLLALAGHLAILLAAAALAQVVAPGLTLLTSALLSFGAASLMASVSIAIAGVGFLAFAMAIKELAATAPSAFANIAKGFVSFISELSAQGPKLMNAAIELIVQFLEGLARGIPRIVAAGIDMIVKLMDGLRKGMPEMVSSAIKLLVTFAQAFMDNIGVIIDIGLQMAIKLVQGLADGLMKYRDPVVKAITDLLQIVADIVLTVLGNLIGPILNKLVEILTPVKDFILGALSELATAIEPIFTPLMDALKVLFESIASIVRSLADAIIAIVQSIAQVVQALAPVFISLFQTIQVVANDIVTIFQTIGQTITNVANAIVAVVQTIGQTIQSVFQSIASIVNSVMQGIVGAINGFANVISAAGEAIKNVFVGIGQGIQAALQGVASVVESIGGAIKAAFEGIGSAARGVGEGIQAALNGVASIIDSVGSAIKSVLEGIGKAFEGAGKFAEGFGKGVKAVMEGVSDVVRAVGDAIKGIIEAIGKAFKDIGVGFEKLGKSMGPISSDGFQAAAAITAISGALVALSGACAGGIVPNFTRDLDQLDTVMYKMNGRGDIGAIFKSMSSGLNSAASAAPKAASALESFANSSDKISSSSKSMESGLKGISSALSSINTATMGSFTGIAATAKAFDMLASSIQKFVGASTAAMAIMTSLTMSFMTAGTSIATLNTNMSSISTGVSAFATGMNNAKTALTTFATSALGSSMSFSVLGTAMAAAMTGLVNAVITGMNNAKSAMQMGFAMMGASASTSMTMVIMSVTTGMLGVTNAINIGMSSVGNTVRAGMTSAAVVMQVGFASMGVGATAAMGMIRVAVMTGMMGVVQSIQTSMTQAAASINMSMSMISGVMMRSMAQINAQMSSSFMMMRASIQMAMMTIQMTIMTSMMQAANVIRSSGTMMQMTMFQTGNQMVSAMRMSMALLAITVMSGTMQAANSVRAAGGVALAGGMYVGSMISQGVANGIRANLGAVIAATNAIVEQAHRAARAKADIHSPSRLFANSVGKFIPQGVAMGIAKEMPKSVAKMSKTFGDAFGEVGSNAIDHANSMATAISDAANSVGQFLDDSLSDMEYKPTITPVVDTTNLDKLQNGNILRGLSVDATNVPRPAYPGVPGSMQSTNTNVYDNSNKEYSITVKVDNGGKPVDGKELAREIQQHIKDFDDQKRRGKGEEVLW